MAKIKCFDLIQHKELAATLKARFDKSVENIESETEQRSIGLLMALKHRDDLGVALNDIKPHSYIVNKSHLNATNIAKEYDGKLSIERKKAVEPIKTPEKTTSGTKAKVGDVLFDTKKGQEVTVTKVTKPSKGSALENEPFIIDIKYKDGTKAINMPIGDRFTNKSEQPTVTQEQAINKTERSVQEKLNSQKETKSNAVIKEQKVQLLDDLRAADDILLGANKDKARDLEKQLTQNGNKKFEIDNYVKEEYEHKDLTALPKDKIEELRRLGIEVKDGALVIDIYKDGTVKVGDIRTAIGIVEKGFPTKSPSKSYGITSLPSPKERDITTKAENYGSMEEANRRLKMEEDNLAEAKAKGNKGLITVMQEALDYERKVHEAAKKVNYEEVKSRIILKPEVRGDYIVSYTDKDGRKFTWRQAKEGIDIFMDGQTIKAGVKRISDVKERIEMYIAQERYDKSQESQPAIKSSIPKSIDGNYEIYEYPMKQKDGSIKTMYGVPTIENKAKEGSQAGNTLHPTLTEAIEQVKENRVEEKRLEIQKIERDKQKQIDEESAAKKAEANKGKTKLELMNEAAAKKILDSKINVNGNIKTKRQFVEDILIAGGHVEKEEVDKLKGPTRLQLHRMDGRQQEEAERKVKEAGKKTEYSLVKKDGGSYVISKAEYDYANSLLETKEVKPEAPKEQPKEEKYVPDNDVTDKYKIGPYDIKVYDGFMGNEEVVDRSNNLVKSESGFPTENGWRLGAQYTAGNLMYYHLFRPNTGEKITIVSKFGTNDDTRMKDSFVNYNKESDTTTTDRIKKNSAEATLKELKDSEKGMIRVADPEAVAQKIKKYTGVEVEVGDGVIRIIKEEKVTDPSRVQEIKNSIAEGEMILKTGKSNGRKLSDQELMAVRNSVDNSKKKIGMQLTDQEPVQKPNEDLGAKNKGKKYEVEPSPISQTEFQDVPKLRNILTKLAGNLGKNFKYSKVRQKFAGFYRPSNSLIAIKRANDISTVSHEMGHYLDDKHKMLDEVSPSLEKELSKYWGGGSKPDKSMSEEQQQIYRQQEGLAEWLRVFVLNPQEAMKSQEIYDLYISKVDKSDRDAISIFGNEIRTLLGQTKLSGISSVVHTDNPEKSTWAKRVFPKFLIEPFESKASFTTALLNQFFDSEEGFRKALRTQGIEKVIPSKDFIMLSRLTLGHDDVFYNVMKNGMINEKYERLVDSKTGEAKTAEWLFNPAKGKDFERDIEINRNRMIAERTVEFIDNLSKDRILEDLNRGLLPPDVILNKFPELRDKVLTVEMDPTTGDPVEITVGEKIDQLKEKVKNPEINPVTGEPIKFKPQPESRYNFAGKDVSGISLGIKDKKRYDYTVAKEALREYETYVSAYPEKRIIYDELKRRYQELADDNLKYALKKGRLSQESYDNIKERNQQYIALSRIKQTEIGTDIFEDSYFTNKAGKAVGDVAEIIKQFKGSTKDIVDPYVALINSSYSIMKEANRNEAIRSFTEMLKGTRDMREGDVTELADIGFRTDSAHDPYTITVYNNGEKEYWRFDPAVYESLKGLDDVTHALPLVLTLYAKILRPSVTTFPVFQARNRIRDLTNRLTVGNNWPSFRDYRNKKQGMMDYELHGGGQFGYHLRNKGSYYDMVEKTMKDVKTDSKTLIMHPDRIGEVYKKILGDSEKKTRIEEYYNTYDKYKKEGYSDYDAKIAATFAARDLMDFKVMGRSIRGFNQVIPFTNAKIQGFRRMYKAASKNPGKTTAKFLIFAMIPQIANSLLIKDQDDDVIQEYKDLSIYRKTLFYNIPIHKLGIPNINWLIIPKPFEIGVIASAIGIPIDDMILGDKMSEQVNSDYVKFLLSAASPVDPMGIVTAQGPIKAVLSNYDSFRQNYIVPDEEKDLDVRLRDTESSSRLGKLGQQLTFNQTDPRQVDYMLKSLFSYYGDLAIRTSNIGRSDAKDKLDLSVTGFLKDTYDSPYTSKDVKWVLEKSVKFQLKSDPDYKEVEEYIRIYNAYNRLDDLSEMYGSPNTEEYNSAARKILDKYKDIEGLESMIGSPNLKEEKVVLKRVLDELATKLRERWESKDLLKYNKELKD